MKMLLNPHVWVYLKVLHSNFSQGTKQHTFSYIRALFPLVLCIFPEVTLIATYIFIKGCSTGLKNSLKCSSNLKVINKSNYSETWT